MATIEQAQYWLEEVERNRIDSPRWNQEKPCDNWFNNERSYVFVITMTMLNKAVDMYGGGGFTASRR
ncbi:MAG: hypothetical protein Q7J15_11090 [Candidatus Desulfaltia sp.]|nr:hypothetical protein [Candidatus Desulfaltia sp.]